MEFNEKDFMDNDTNINNKINNIEYLYFDYIDINLGDPISSIVLTNKYVIIGTMTGGIKLYYFKQVFILFEILSNISTIFN